MADSDGLWPPFCEIALDDLHPPVAAARPLVFVAGIVGGETDDGSDTLGEERQREVEEGEVAVQFHGDNRWRGSVAHLDLLSHLGQRFPAAVHRQVSGRAQALRYAIADVPDGLRRAATLLQQ